jgi:hypothetical protein
MRKLTLLRYALLLVAAFAYANGRPTLAAAPAGLQSCDECDENSPCDTECTGVYYEEPWQTTCGAHRNWGGTCAGECTDGFCDPWENTTNCCADCNPGNCGGGGGPCEPDWEYDFVSGPSAQAPVVGFTGFVGGVYHWTCDWREWNLWNVHQDNCEEPADPGYQCESWLMFTTWDVTSVGGLTSDGEAACAADMYTNHSVVPFGTPGECGQ